MASIDPISKNDDIVFKCTKDIPCFNKCCHGLNQTLTGFDILKMARQKQMPTYSFLKHYTFSYTGKQTGVPVVNLFEQPDKENACIFLAEEGCGVYEARPLSCRLYPVARGVSIDAKNHKIREHYAVINEDHCEGFGKGFTMTVLEWIKDQEANEYIEANDHFMELLIEISKNGIKPDKTQKDIILLGCYNSDLFLEKLEAGELSMTNTPDIAELKQNDLLLFKTGVEWAKQQILNN